jgi:hypothetical protein
MRSFITPISESTLNRFVYVNLVHQILPSAVLGERFHQFVGFFFERHGPIIRIANELRAVLTRGFRLTLESRSRTSKLLIGVLQFVERRVVAIVCQ